jgi:hypothetical protein
MTAARRRTWGTILIWLGIFAWAPFLVLIASGEEVSIFPFLAAHLAGVLGGAWLRASADRMEGLNQAQDRQGQRRRIASRVLIYLGVLAWAPYFYLERVIGQDVDIFPFLAAHLTGVLGGAALRASVELDRLTRRL